MVYVMFTVENITRYFGRFKALDNVSFNVDNGEIVGYVGLNGAGKTTTIRICVGVLRPSSGDVVVDGYSITRQKREASFHIGWVPELPIFELDEKAIDYFVYLAGYYGLSRSEARRLGKELFEQVGLSRFMERRLKHYSLGMKKRFALAVSMINDPRNFFFDEVLNGLDPKGIAFFRDLVKRFKREGRAVLFSSHILSEVENIADKVVFIHKGRIIAVKTMDEIKSMVKPALVVKVSNPDDKLPKILEKYGEVRARDGKYILVFKEKPDKNQIVRELVENGYSVEEIRPARTSLEKVFFKLIGEAGEER